MTKKKVKLAYIINDSLRKTTFKKRKKGLIKKGLSILDLNDMGWLIEQTLKNINKKMEKIGGLVVQDYKPPVALIMQAIEKKLGKGEERPLGFKAKVDGMPKQP